MFKEYIDSEDLAHLVVCLSRDGGADLINVSGSVEVYSLRVPEIAVISTTYKDGNVSKYRCTVIGKKSELELLDNMLGAYQTTILRESEQIAKRALQRANYI